MKTVSFREYIVEVLKNAIYEKGESSDVIIAEAPDLPGCFTQGKNFEEARQNLIDAIELWVTVGLKKGEEMPVVNGHRSVTDVKTHELFDYEKHYETVAHYGNPTTQAMQPR